MCVNVCMCVGSMSVYVKESMCMLMYVQKIVLYTIFVC